MRPGFAAMAGAIIACMIFAAPLAAQEDGPDLRHELGFWLGASNPMPFSEADQVLDSNIGGGGFYRLRWPWILYTEFGFSYSTYFSQTTQKLTVVPVYGALAYKLPLDFQLNIFLKVGGGASYLVLRPQNLFGWDPMMFAGAEFSILAGRKVRIGLRLDYNNIYEKHLDPPVEQQLLQYFGSPDARLQTNSNFRIRNGGFFHFGLMVSFIL